MSICTFLQQRKIQVTQLLEGNLGLIKCIVYYEIVQSPTKKCVKTNCEEDKLITIKKLKNNLFLNRSKFESKNLIEIIILQIHITYQLFHTALFQIHV